MPRFNPHTKPLGCDILFVLSFLILLNVVSFFRKEPEETKNHAKFVCEEFLSLCVCVSQLRPSVCLHCMCECVCFSCVVSVPSFWRFASHLVLAEFEKVKVSNAHTRTRIGVFIFRLGRLFVSFSFLLFFFLFLQPIVVVWCLPVFVCEM